jgi:hypothetical protein
MDFRRVELSLQTSQNELYSSISIKNRELVIGTCGVAEPGPFSFCEKIGKSNQTI